MGLLLSEPGESDKSGQSTGLCIRWRSLKAGAQLQGTAANKWDPEIQRENELGVILQCVSKRWVRKGRFFLSPLILIFGGNYLIICQPVLHPGQFFLSPKFFQVTWLVCALMKSWNFRRKATLLTNKNTISEKNNFLEKENPHLVSTENFQINIMGLGIVIIPLSLGYP